MRVKSRPVRFLAALAAAALLAGSAIPARADLQSDPDALYALMKNAYSKGIADGWHYDDQLYYFSAVLDAGRAYSLRRPTDPNANEIHGLTIDLATALHYDPLTNDDAAEWYIREAASAEVAAKDPVRGPQGQALLAKLDAADNDINALAAEADDDGTAIAAQFPGDIFAVLSQVQDELRAYVLTHDAKYRSLALKRAAAPGFPLANIADPYAHDLYESVSAAIAGRPGYNAGDTANAKAISANRAAIHQLPIVGRVDVLSHDARLNITAPADEYFGKTKLSPLGVRNEITRINKYLDAGWGSRMTGDAEYLVDSIEDWQHQYPRDYAMAQVLLESYETIERIDSKPAQSLAQQVKAILLVQYFQTTQAQSLLSS